MPRVVFLDAGACTISVLPLAIPDNGTEPAVITIRVLDDRGEPMGGLDASEVVVASTGTGNTITQPTGFTDQDGYIEASIVSTVPESKTLSVTVLGTAVTATATLTVEGEVVPLINEDFSTYTDSADLKADPNNWYAGTGAGNLGNVTLDTTDGFGTLTQCMKYTMSDRTADTGSRCTDYIVSIGTLDIRNTLGTTARTLWVEAYIKFSANFTTIAPAGWSCGSNADYKTMFGQVFNAFGDASPTSRFNFTTGNGSWGTVAGYPTNETVYQNADPAQDYFWDNEWHQLRFLYQCGTDLATVDGRAAFAVDGSTIYDSGSVVIPRVLWGVLLGGNLNQGPAQEQTVKWGRVRVYNTDPGWTF
jgi:hypothetical protein